MTSSLPTQGFNLLGVEVLSIEGEQALVRDQMGRQHRVPVAVQRAHGVLPQPGESWLIDRSLGNEWTFAAIVGGDTQRPMQVVANATERNAIQRPYVDMAVYQLDTYSAWRWTGTAWQERVPPQFASLQTQLDAKPRGLLKIVRWPSDITIINTQPVLMESLSVPLVTGRTYKVIWHTNQAGSLAAGPPNGSSSIVTAVGSVVATSPSIRGCGIRVYNATQEVYTLTAFFDAGANETRAFGVVGNSGSASASITYYGGQGRFLSVEDVGPTPS